MVVAVKTGFPAVVIVRVNENKAGCVLALFVAAVMAVGATGVGLLYCWGYKARGPAAILPVAVIVELALYLLVASRRTGVVAYWAPPLGMVVRGLMAIVAAVVWPAADGFWPSVLVYYAANWLGVIIHIVLATFVVWLVADVSVGRPAPAGTEPAGRTGGTTTRAGVKSEMLDQLVGATSRPPQARPVRDRAPIVEPQAPGHRPRPAPAPAGPPAGVREPAGEGGEEAPIIVPEESLRAPEQAAGPPIEETSELEPVTDAPEPAGVEAEEAAGPQAAEVVAAGVAEVVRAATGLEGLQIIGALDELAVVANLPERADAAAATQASGLMAAAAQALATAGLLGTPQAIAMLLRAGGAYIVPGTDTIVLVSLQAPGSVGQVVAAARRLAGQLMAPWPEALAAELPQAAAAQVALPALDEWARGAGQQVAWHSVPGCGLVATVASPGSVHGPLAAAAGLMWQAASDLGRVLSTGGPKQIVVLHGAGAAAMARGEAKGIGAFVVVRASPSAQAGLVTAELDRIIALCQGQ